MSEDKDQGKSRERWLKALLRLQTLSKNLKKVRQGTTWVSGESTSQEQE